MSQLTANAPQIYEVGDVNAVPVKGSSEIFLGSAVGITSGFGRQLVAGDVFGGFAEQHINNTGADGALAVPVKRSGRIQVAISALAVTDVGKPVYASDGNDLHPDAGHEHPGRLRRALGLDRHRHCGVRSEIGFQCPHYRFDGRFGFNDISRPSLRAVLTRRPTS
jgi:hypothetical protein